MKILAQFKTIPNYADFCIPELKSFISMHNLDWREVFKHEFVSEEEEDSIQNIDQVNAFPHYPYIFYCDPLSNKKKQVFPKNITDVRHTIFRRFPFVYLEFPNVEICQQIMKRSILIDVLIEIISEGNTYDEIVKNTDKEILSKHNNEDSKFLFEVDPYNSHLTQQEAIDRIEIMTEQLFMKGKIDLKNPQKKFWVMERHVDPFTSQTDNKIVNTLLDVYFGVEVGRSKSNSRISYKENFLHQYDLRNRVYLGPTSTDSILSFLMCNQGAVKQGDMVFDPFVGTGSLIIPPSHHGAICFGGDLDPRVLHGFGVGRLNKKSNFYQKNQEYCNEMKPKIMLNFEQYELPKPVIIRMDCVNTNFREVEVFDAIICDPPYGIRAMTRTAGKRERKRDQKKQNKNQDEDNQNEEDDEQQDESLQQNKDEQEKIQENITDQVKELENLNKQENQQEEEQKIDGQLPIERTCFAPTKQISVDNIVNGLLGLGNRILVPGGRLIFLYPVDREFYNVSQISNLSFPNFTLLDYSENPLSEKKSRILITLQKNKSLKEFQEEEKLKEKQNGKQDEQTEVANDKNKNQ